MQYKSNERCRVCGNPDLQIYLDLGQLPLSNNLGDFAIDTIHDRKFPLQVVVCRECILSQLSIVVDPELMFSNYTYRSSISSTYIKHCEEMAEYLKAKHKLSIETFHVDIAGNDGALLQAFKKHIKGRQLNIDPARNLKAICESKGINYMCEFFGPSAAETVKARYGKVDLITATNVIAHVDDVRSFLFSALNMLRKETGIMVIEFPYIIDFIEKGEFDTIYFEHVSYMGLTAIKHMLEEVENFNIIDVVKSDIHGGSLQVTIGTGSECELATRMMREERDRFSFMKPYDDFARRATNSINNFRTAIKTIGKKHKVAAFAASAKGNTLLNVSHMTVNDIAYIVDETPEKIGKYSPGVRIPIVDMDHMFVDPPDYIVILSWNFADDIMSKLREFGYKGRFIIPIPEIKIL